MVNGGCTVEDIIPSRFTLDHKFHPFFGRNRHPSLIWTVEVLIHRACIMGWSSSTLETSNLSTKTSTLLETRR